MLAGVLLALVPGACAFRPARAIPEIPAGEWHATLGGPSRAAYRDQAAPTAPREGWREGFATGLRTAPVVHGDLLILGNARLVTAASARTGHQYWTRRFDGAVVGAPLRQDTLLLIATASRHGKVHALSLARGRARWETRLRSPVTSEPLLLDGRFFAATVRQQLYALDATTGDVAWQIRLPGQSVVAPVAHDRALLVATQRDTLLRVRAADGAIEATTALPGSVSAAPALADSTLVLPMHPDRVAGYHARTLAPLWSVRVDAPVLAAPVIDADGTIHVLTRSGSVWRIAGGAATRIAALGGAARESLTLVRNGLLVGRLDGTLVLLDRDGTEQWREQFRSSIAAPVAAAGGELFVPLVNGTVVNLR